MQAQIQNQPLGRAFPFVVAGLAAAFMTTGTRWGTALGPDSVSYVTAARCLLRGQGLSVFDGHGHWIPMTHFPPLLPVALAGFGLLGLDPLVSVRWLNVVLFAVNFSVLGGILRQYTRTIWSAYAASAAVFFSWDILAIHGSAFSEPLFIFFTLLTLAFLERYLREGRHRWLLISALACSLAVLTRYAGFALACAAAASILVFGPFSARKRLLGAGAFAGASCAPTMAWIVRNLIVGHSAVNRQLLFHPPTVDHLSGLVLTLSLWVLPGRVPVGIRFGVGIAAILGIGGLCLRNLWPGGGKHEMEPVKGCVMATSRAAAMFVVVYIVFLLVSISLVDVHTPLDYRILAPWYVVVGLLAAPLVLKTRILSDRKLSIARTGGLLFVLWFGFFVIVRAQRWLGLRLQDSEGYASLEWRTSDTISWIRSAPARQVIYTNGADAVHILTDRLAKSIPSKFSPSTRRANPNYHSELDAMLRDMRDHEAVLVFLRAVTWRSYTPTEEELRGELPLVLIAEESDGAIYRAAT